jgi:hypothetical protein
MENNFNVSHVEKHLQMMVFINNTYNQKNINRLLNNKKYCLTKKRKKLLKDK